MKTNRLKSFALATVAAVSFAAPMAFASPATAAQGYEQRHDQRDDRRDDRRDARDDRRDDRRDARDDRREHRQDHRQDRRDWRRGERASAQDRHYWRQVDYRRNHWRAPPRGYQYVRDDRSGQYLMVGIATGVILSVIASR